MSDQRESTEELVVPATVRRRREHAAMVRRRQLLLIDMAAALVLAIVFIVVAPGLAIVAIGSLLVLLGCGASLLYGRVRAHAARRRSARRSATVR
jgi:hypothetical protein